jgi:hypothetical protein
VPATDAGDSEDGGDRSPSTHSVFGSPEQEPDYEEGEADVAQEEAEYEEVPVAVLMED